jgi:hypothetical protein
MPRATWRPISSLLVPVATTGTNGLYKPWLKTFFPPVWATSLASFEQYLKDGRRLSPPCLFTCTCFDGFSWIWFHNHIVATHTICKCQPLSHSHGFNGHVCVRGGTGRRSFQQKANARWDAGWDEGRLIELVLPARHVRYGGERM